MKYFKPILPFLLLGLFAGCEKEDVVPLSNARSITKCIAHRGVLDRSDPSIIENSMSAFEAAYQAGAQGTELDLFLTQDGVPVISHGGNLGELGKSKPGKVCPVATGFSGLTAAELKENCLLINGDEVPFFEDVLARFSGREFYLILDFKYAPDQRTIDLMKRYYQGRSHLLLSEVTITNSFYRDLKLRSELPGKLLITAGTYKFGTENGVDGIEAETLGDMDIALLHEKGKVISLYNVEDYSELKHYVEKNVDFITTFSMQSCLEAKR